MHVCTIIASNYAAFARVLGRSHREHHPESTCFVLVIDDHEGRLDPATEPFELITPADLQIEHFDRMAALYDVLELSTAVKPWLLRHLLDERGCETLAYLDPDIEIFDRLDEIDALAREHRLVVTPHLTAPMPRDGRKPSETDILVAGSYNLGFIGIAPGADTAALLDWWGERLETDCVVAPERGYFVDQRWMDFAPGLVPTIAVLRDPGYNVAYWNLPSREVREEPDGRWTVNGRPLRFFHYSGFDPRVPDRLSKHQDRIDLTREPALRALCARYAERLLSEGHDEAQRWSYRYDELPGGIRLDAAGRLAIRRAIENGELHESPFTEDGAQALVDHLAAAPGGDSGHGVSRYLLALLETREDLRAAFPDIRGEDARRYLAWAQTVGRATVPIPAALLPGASRAARALAREPRGVNVAGYFRSILGVGEAGRQVVRALESAGVPVAPVGLNASASRQDESLGAGPGGSARYATNLLCVNADVMVPFADQMGPEFFEGRYTIGLWWWEVSTFPERWLGSFEHLDEVWAGSRHVADALAAVSPIPVVHVRQPVHVEPAVVERAALGLPAGFLFLFSFDYHSVFERKNPIAAIEAFTSAFDPGEGPQLVIKTINHEHYPAAHARLVAAAAGRPDIHLYERYVSREERDAITAACDCYVSLHRSEGFGFTVAEAMALGRPAIVTAYSGTMDFTTAANSYLVDYELVPIGAGLEPYPPEGEWAQPDVAHAARLMREVAEDPEAARRKGERARADMRARHSPEAAGRLMAERLARVAVAGAGARRAAPPPGAFDAERVRTRASGDPPTPSQYRFGAPQRLARKTLLRTLKPYTAHARSVDLDLVRGLEAVDRSLAAMATRDEVDHVTERIDSLVAQVDTLRADLGRALGFMSSFGLGDAAAHGDALDLGGWPEAPDAPWTPEYVERHREYVTRALDDPALLNLLKSGGALPSGYGSGFDERVVEFPWGLTRDLGGRILDAGSTLNHPHVLIRLRPRVEDLHIVTLAPEPQAFPFLDVSYLYADLRELPIRDATYDRVVSLSTLEHIGMDNTHYGDDSPRSSDPSADLGAAMSELRRVLKPGGTLYLTVPYGRAADLGWQQVFDAAGLDALVEAFQPGQQTREFFRYTAAGWQRSTADEAADAVYRDHFSDPAPAPDRAVAARAIACLELR